MAFCRDVPLDIFQRDLKKRRLYRCARPWGAHAVLATEAEAAELRRTAQLFETEPPRAALARLGEAGFVLPYLYGYWGGWLGDGTTKASWIGRTLAWTRLLARGRLVLSIDLRRDELGDTRISRWTMRRIPTGTASRRRRT